MSGGINIMDFTTFNTMGISTPNLIHVVVKEFNCKDIHLYDNLVCHCIKL
jgi:hypothetical protein